MDFVERPNSSQRGKWDNHRPKLWCSFSRFPRNLLSRMTWDNFPEKTHDLNDRWTWTRPHRPKIYTSTISHVSTSNNKDCVTTVLWSLRIRHWRSLGNPRNTREAECLCNDLFYLSLPGMMYIGSAGHLLRETVADFSGGEQLGTAASRDCVEGPCCLYGKFVVWKRDFRSQQAILESPEAAHNRESSGSNVKSKTLWTVHSYCSVARVKRLGRWRSSLAAKAHPEYKAPYHIELLPSKSKTAKETTNRIVTRKR